MPDDFYQLSRIPFQDRVFTNRCVNRDLEGTVPNVQNLLQGLLHLTNELIILCNVLPELAVLVIIRKVKIIHVIQDDAGQYTDNQAGEAGMYLAHFHALCTLTGPELVFVSVLRGLLVHLFQFVSIPAVPDSVPDGVRLEVQDLVNLDTVPTGRQNVQPATHRSFDVLIQF